MEPMAVVWRAAKLSARRRRAIVSGLSSWRRFSEWAREMCQVR